MEWSKPVTIFTKTFVVDALERAAKTAAQSVILALGGGATNVLTLDWATLAGAAGGGALLSLLTSIGSAGIRDTGTASLTTAVGPTEP